MFTFLTGFLVQLKKVNIFFVPVVVSIVARATPSSYIFLPLVHLLLFAVCGELESFDKSNIIEVGSIGIACLILFAI